MKQPGPERRSLRALASRITASAILAASLVLGCAWDPWIPGEKNWNPEIVVNPGDLSKLLPLGVPYVDDLDCYSSSCEKRFRLVVEEAGQLTVIAMPELSHQDSQARIVLESLQGVLAKAATGRGPQKDVVALTVAQAVNPGMYFVLIQSVGGRLPYQLTAYLEPGAGPPPTGVTEKKPPPRVAPSGPPPRLVAVPLSGTTRGGYDPAVTFSTLRTFSFGATGGDADTAARTEQPVDRMVRRFIADEMILRGLQQATGNEPADLIVDFSVRRRNRSMYGVGSLYDRYDFGAIGWGGRGGVDTRATLTVDLVDTQSDRVAWHAETTKGIGPGIAASGDAETLLVREAVTDVLAGFPPR